MGRNVTGLNANEIDIAHTRCLQKHFTRGVVHKTNTRVIKNDTTIIIPTHLSNIDEVMMKLRNMQGRGKIERAG